MLSENLLVYLSLSLAGLLLIWNIWLQISILKVKKSQKILLGGKKADSLEKIILKNQTDTLENQEKIEKIGKFAQTVHSLALQSIHQVGLVRFNPFRDIGGDQSFSLALLDHQKNGVVISSLYSREGVRVYSKAVKNGQPVKHPLTDEEKYVIEKASIEKNSL